MAKEELPCWWGDFTFSLGNVFLWQIGPLNVWLKRREKEWRIAYERETVSDGNRCFPNTIVRDIDMSELPNLTRFAFREAKESLQILPALADRSVVAKPSGPIFLSPGEETEVYVSTPLWFTVQSLEKNGLFLEFPVIVPSDTWFGQNTLEGDICYASQTLCRTSLENFPFYLHRAVTPLAIQNHAKTPIQIEQLSLPVGFLSLYATQTGYLWTQKLTLKREDEEGDIAVKISKDVPNYFGETTLVNGPRVKAGKNIFTWALNNLLG